MASRPLPRRSALSPGRLRGGTTAETR
jgi:hypothetical protein